MRKKLSEKPVKLTVLSQNYVNNVSKEGNLCGQEKKLVTCFV